MRWKLRVSRAVMVEADTPADAIHQAKAMQHGEGWAAQIEDLTREGDEMLFPEYSRRILEEQYHLLNAAMRVAALEALPRGSDEQKVGDKIGEWLDQGAVIAERSAVIRKLRNVKGTKQ